MRQHKLLSRGLQFERTPNGLVICRVRPASAGSVAGFEPGDSIRAYFGRPLIGPLSDEIVARLYGQCLVEIMEKDGACSRRWINFGSPD